MAVGTPTGNAALHELAVVLEVHGKDGLTSLKAAHLSYAAKHVLALLDRGNEISARSVTDRHVVEEPRPSAPLLYDEVEELIRGHTLDVVAGIAGRGAKKQAIAAHELKGIHDLVKRPVPTATVIHVGLIALKRHREDDVTRALHVLTEGFVNKRCVGEDVEHAVAVLLRKPQNVRLAHQGLAAGKHVEVAAQLRALGHQAVHVLIREVKLVAVFCCPTAFAMLVAGARRVEEDDPRDVAIILLGHLKGGLEAPKCGLVTAVEYERPQHGGVSLVDYFEQPPLPLGSGIESFAHAVCRTRDCPVEQLFRDVNDVHNGTLSFVSFR